MISSFSSCSVCRQAATLGSQEGAFENVRLSFQGDQGQQLRQLLTSNAIRRVAMCALSSVKGHRQHLAVNHDKGKVGFFWSFSFISFCCSLSLYIVLYMCLSCCSLSLSFQITFLQLFPILRQTQSNRRKLTLTVSLSLSLILRTCTVPGGRNLIKFFCPTGYFYGQRSTCEICKSFLKCLALGACTFEVPVLWLLYMMQCLQCCSGGQ